MSSNFDSAVWVAGMLDGRAIVGDEAVRVANLLANIRVRDAVGIILGMWGSEQATRERMIATRNSLESVDMATGTTPAVATLAGMFCYLLGESDDAFLWAQDALSVDPDYNLARLLGLLTRGVSPEAYRAGTASLSLAECLTGQLR